MRAISLALLLLCAHNAQAAFSYVGGATNGGASGTTASVTHGQTIDAGDLVVACLNVNGTQTITADGDTGTGWTAAHNAAAGGPSATHALFYRVANGSEPSSYTWTLQFSDRWRVNVGVFNAASPVVDADDTTDLQVGSTTTIVAGAADGVAIADDALSIICGGKDTSGDAEAYTTANNSYTGVVGDSGNQAAAMAHRIYTTGTTFSGDITITPTDGADNVNTVTYSIHISFVEMGGGAAGVVVNPISGKGGAAAQPIVN